MALSIAKVEITVKVIWIIGTHRVFAVQTIQACRRQRFTRWLSISCKQEVCSIVRECKRSNRSTQNSETYVGGFRGAVAILPTSTTGTAFGQSADESKMRGQDMMFDKDHMVMMDKMSVGRKTE